MSQVDLGSLYPPCPPPSINLVFPKPFFGCFPSSYVKSNILKVAYRHMIWPLSSSHSSSLALCYVIISFLKPACRRTVLCSSSVALYGSSNEPYHFASRPSNVLLLLQNTVGLTDLRDNISLDVCFVSGGPPAKNFQL